MTTSDLPSIDIDLRAELARLGMSQRTLAQAINAEEASVSRWANGLRIPDHWRPRIAEALGLVIDGPVPA
jgi:ribosome-binding protein aMBF1 (putative translation factor)